MRKFIFFLFWFCISGSLLAQYKFSITVKNAVLLKGEYYSGGIFYPYSVAANYNIKKKISIGININCHYQNQYLLKNKLDVINKAYLFGINSKYYYSRSEGGYFTNSLFLGIEIGFVNNIEFSNPFISRYSCTSNYKLVSHSHDFYSNIHWGFLMFPEQRLSLIVQLLYQFRYPKIGYEVPTCLDGEIVNFTKKEEFINFNALLFSLGLQFNFN